MGLFPRNLNKAEFLLIVGCGRLGANLANSLSNRNGNVLIIDRNKEAFRKLSPSYGGLTLEGDAANIDILQEARIEDVQILVCATDNDNTNIMVAQIGKRLFQVPHVVARLYDTDRAPLCEAFDILTICPSVLSIKEYDRLMGNRGKDEVR